MTIQQVLSNYPSVEKAFIKSQDRSDGTIYGSGVDYAVNELLPFNTLKGHVEAFFRDNDVHINIVRYSDTLKFHTKEVFVKGYKWDIAHNFYVLGFDDQFDTYETAFISALEAACKYLNPKLPPKPEN